MALVPLIGLMGCEQSTAGAAIAPTTAPAVVVVITTGAIVAAPFSYCANVGVLSPDLNLIVTSTHADVAVDEVTLHLLDGSNVGGPGITFPQPALNAQFANTTVRGGTSRTFVLTPTFRCGVSTPRSIRGDVGIVDPTGTRTLLSTTVGFP
jgi:hypothetical protein